MVRTKLDTTDSAWSTIGARPQSGDAGAPAAEEIARQIQDLIITEGLSEGDRVPSERDLAELLSTSRPTVSQAIRILVTQGLVESRRGSGAYVTNRPLASIEKSVGLMLDLNEASVGQLNELRLWLETTGVVTACERASEDDLAKGAEALESLISDVGDTAAWMSADTKFHATLVRAADNPYLAAIYESVHATLINYEYRAWIDSGAVPRWLEKSNSNMEGVHRPILEAVKARDAEAARFAVLSHHEAMGAHLTESQSG
jgi:GntR family transcriptional regulator, transcriptional repressor for pyruvate dehydrogenase complex